MVRCCWVPAPSTYVDGGGDCARCAGGGILIVYGGGLLLGHLNDQGKARRKAAADKEEKKQIRKKYDAKKRAVVTVAVLGVFGLLIALKYVNFLGESAYGIAGLFGSKSAYQRCKFCCPWVFLTIPVCGQLCGGCVQR